MRIRKTKGVVLLRLSSEDLSNAKETMTIVEDLLQVDGENKFVIDVSNVSLMSSLQIGTIVTLHLTCYENVAVMKLAGVSDSNKKVLKLVGLDKLMEIHHGADVARASFGESSRKSSSKNAATSSGKRSSTKNASGEPAKRKGISTRKKTKG